MQRERGRERERGHTYLCTVFRNPRGVLVLPLLEVLHTMGYVSWQTLWDNNQLERSHVLPRMALSKYNHPSFFVVSVSFHHCSYKIAWLYKYCMSMCSCKPTWNSYFQGSESSFNHLESSWVRDIPITLWLSNARLADVLYGVVVHMTGHCADVTQCGHIQSYPRI